MQLVQGMIIASSLHKYHTTMHWEWPFSWGGGGGGGGNTGDSITGEEQHIGMHYLDKPGYKDVMPVYL